MLKSGWTILVAIGIGVALGWQLKPSEKSTSMAGKQATSEVWTCSMHPQIRQNEKSVCPLCDMDLVPLSSSNSDDPTIFEMTPASVKLAELETIKIGGEQGSVEKKVLRLTGKIKVDERKIALQTAHISGRIEQLFVTFTGEPISKGQKLATIYSPELVAAQQELLEAAKWEKSNPSLLEATKSKLRNWKLSENQIETIVKSGKTVSEMTVFADATGIVTNKKIKVGDYVRTGEALFEVANLNQLWVIFDAYEEDLPYLKLGDKATFTAVAAPNKTFSTTVSYIDPIINPDTRTAAVRCEIRNDGTLKPEMFVQAELTTRLPKIGQISVPKTAVLWTGERSVVYVKMPTANVPTFQFREVEIGETSGDNYLIINGLELGEEVVTQGAFSVDAAAQLSNKASMMNRTVAVKGQAKKDVQIPDFRAMATPVLKKSIEAVIGNYLRLKDGLVETNPQKSAKEALELAKTIGKVGKDVVPKEAATYWQRQQKAMGDHASNLAQTTDVEAQRKQFQHLSEVLIETVIAFGVDGGEPLYIQHCPMADDNRGADWISKEKNIRNPYFGDVMLRCGSVKKEL